MKTNSNIEELKDALETIRSEQFPEVSHELLDSILRVEFENQDNRSIAHAKTMKVLDDFMLQFSNDTLPKCER